MKLGAGAALGYASALICQGVLVERGLAASTVLSFRFGVSGLLLVALCALSGRPLLPVPGERLRLLLLGAACFMAPCSLYYSATEHGSPAAAIVLVYLYPTLVTLAESVAARRRPSAALTASLVLSTVGCALVAAAGSSVTIEPIGVVYALGGAAAFAAYMFLSVRTGKRSDPVAAGGAIALGAGGSFIVQALLGPGFGAATGSIGLLVGTGVANALGLGLTFAALRRLGTARASIVFTLEAVFTVVLAAVFLGDALGPWQMLGGVAVLGAAVLSESDALRRDPHSPHQPAAAAATTR